MPILRLLAYVLVAAACVFSVGSVARDQENDCKSEQRLRDDIAFVLEGAGENERAQLAILNRLGTQAERDALMKTFEPGLAAALERIDKNLEC